MDLLLFQDMTPAERIEMLDAQADEVTEESYLRPYSNEELADAREEYVALSLQLAQIKSEEDEMKAQFKERKSVVDTPMRTLLGNIKQGGEYKKGKLYKLVDRDERVTGFYNEEGRLVSQRKSLPGELGATVFSELRRNEGSPVLRMKKTGTEE